MVVVGIIGSTTSYVLSENVEAYAFIKNRQSALSDIRYALNLMTNELLAIGRTPGVNDLTALTATSVTFNSASTPVTFSIGDYQGQQALLRDAEPMVVPVQSVTFTGVDAAGVDVPFPAVLADVKTIQINVSTDPIGDEGSISLSTKVVPRIYIYGDSYQ